MWGNHHSELCHPIILLIHLFPLFFFFSPLSALSRLSFLFLCHLRLLLESWWASVVLKWKWLRSTVVFLQLSKSVKL